MLSVCLQSIAARHTCRACDFAGAAADMYSMMLHGIVPVLPCACTALTAIATLTLTPLPSWEAWEVVKAWEVVAKP